MKNVAVALLVFGFVGSVASAGTVSFDAQETVIDRGAGDSFIVELTLTVTDAAGPYDSLDVMVGSDNLIMSGFVFDTPDVFRVFDSNSANNTVYASGIKFGYFGSEGPMPSNQLLGILTVDASGLADGTYFVVIDAELDNGASKATVSGVPDFLFGQATITIVPEPATLALLGIGGVATALRRRRTA